MKKVAINIAMGIALLSYIMGLSNYVVFNLTHVIHHTMSHTLHKHHNHSHTDIESHGHSHNSFVDYYLFIEENEKQKDNQEDSTTPQVYERYFNHLKSLGVSLDICLVSTTILPDILNNLVIAIDIKPPYPPPKFC